MRQCRDVDLNHVQLSPELRIGELASESESGVVDQHFDRNVLVVQKVEDRLRGIGAPKIGGEDVDPGAVFSLELTRCRLERIALARHEHEIETLAGENLGDLESDAAGAAGDERRPTLGAVSF